MAEPKKKQEGHTEASTAGPRNNLVTILVVGGLMLVEGVVLLVAVNIMGAPDTSMAGQVGMGGAPDLENGGPSEVEIHVTDMSAFNDRGGVVYVYHVSVYARVESQQASRIKRRIENRSNTINDRLGKTVRSADPKYFDEPGLETMRRQFKNELGEILGDQELIIEILFPEFSKTRAD